jgi:hypothetical protein
MEHDTSLGTELRLRQRRVTADPEEPELRHGRPAPSIRRERAARSAQSTRRETEVDSLAASMPLILIGVACTAFGIYVRFEETHAAIDRIPLWLPLVAIGIIALLGGILSIFASPSETFDAPPPEPARRRAEALPMRRPTPPVRAETWEPEDASAEEEPAVRHRPTSRPERVVPPLGRTASSAPGRSLERSPAQSPATRDDESENLSSLLDELDSIDGDLHGSPPSSGPAPPNPAPPSHVEADAAAIEAELADLVGVAAPAAVAPRPSPPRLLRPSSVPPPRPGVVHCVECGSRMDGAGTVVRCHGCQEPLCPECQGRSVEEGKPGLCVFCSVLDEFGPKGAASADPSESRPLA